MIGIVRVSETEAQYLGYFEQKPLGKLQIPVNWNRILVPTISTLENIFIQNGIVYDTPRVYYEYRYLVQVEFYHNLSKRSSTGF